MLNAGRDPWTDDKIRRTVTTHFVYAHLGEAAQLQIPHSVDTSGHTYAQHIVSRAKRLLLTLIDIGNPAQITRLVDEFYDDDFLPFAEDEVASLRLSRNGGTNLERLFYLQQFKYLVRVVREGEHIRYAPVEYAPVHVIEQKSSNIMTEASEMVKLPSPVDKSFVRRQIRLQQRPSEIDILSEIAATKPLAHEHLLSVYGSYTQDDHIFILFTPTPKWNLKTFLGDLPKVFEAQTKVERRKQLFTWPLCLANALAWLHAQDAHHGAVRPSRIIIDDHFQISLGHFEGNWLLGQSTPKDDLESYQYAAPEFWKRSLTAQSHGNTSGNTSSRARIGGSRAQGQSHSDTASNAEPTEWGKTMGSGEERSYTFVPTFQDNSSRLKLKVRNRSSNDWHPHGRTSDSRLSQHPEVTLTNYLPARSLSRKLNAMSIHSSNSSEGARESGEPRSRFAYSIPIDTKTTMVQAWKSSVHDQAAADVFGLAAVTMDIMTVACGRSVSAFAKYRATKNRQAGRGGGMADASFHANIIQVIGWAEAILKDSDKKAKKDNGGPFRATEHILQDTIRCFEKDPNKRMKAKVLATQWQQYLSHHAGINDPHCTLRLPSDSATSSQQSNSSRAESRANIYEDEVSSLPDTGRSKSIRTQTERTIASSQSDVTPALTSQTSPKSVNTTFNSPFPPRIPQIGHVDDEPISPDTFDYYDDYPTTNPARAEIQYHTQPDPHRILYRHHHIDVDHEDHVKHDPHTHTHAYTHLHTPYLDPIHAPPPHWVNTKYAVYPKVATNPPNRGLPALPPTASTTHKKTATQARSGSKRPITPRSANVTQATQMLAQTVGGAKR